ncbi:MAG: response regulator transcription factor [Clostridia bacterium]|nr:response regulator transcription factor [Clostridia bacterium]
MAKILVAEDDSAILALVVDYLSADGHSVTACKDGAEALEAFEKKEYDLLISDIMMPRMDGFSLLEKVRKENEQIPVLFLTALGDKTSKQLGFRLGIDDYVTKPFDADELTLRVRALLRRAQVKTEKALVIGNFKMDEEEHTAYLNGEEVALTVREFDLLFKLLSYPKKTFTRSALMDEFWDYDSSATSRTVDVYMAKIREKTADADGFEILTVHGLGYKAVLK